MAKTKARNVTIRTKRDSVSETHVSRQALTALVGDKIAGDTFYDFGFNEEDKRVFIEAFNKDYNDTLARRSNTYTTYRSVNRNSFRINCDSALQATFEARGFSSLYATELTRALIHRSYHSNEMNKSEVILASFALLNEFIAQDKITTVGEFFDKHWDELLPQAFKLKFNLYSHSANLLKDLNNGSLLLIRPMNLKSEQAVLEGLTKQEALHVLNNHAQTSRYSKPSNKDAPAILRNVIREMKGESNVSVSEDYIRNLVYRIASKKLGAMRLESPLNPTAIWVNFTNIFQTHWYRAVTRDEAKETPNTIHTNRVKVYLEFIEENIEKFTERELLMALLLWMNKGFVSRTGKRDDTMKILEAIFEKYKDDQETLFEAIRVMAQGAAYYDEILPTLTQWRKALEEGAFESIVSMELFYMIVGGEEQKRAIDTNLQSFRAVFGKE